MGSYRSWAETPEAMAGFMEMYGIPEDVPPKLDNPKELFEGYSFLDGWMPFPLVSIIEGDVRFPVHPLLRACLATWHLSPCQLMPNGFKVIMRVTELNKILGINLGVRDIEDIYDLCKTAGDGHSYYLHGEAEDGALRSTSGMIQNQWQTHGPDLSLFRARNEDDDGYPFPLPDYTNFACGVNGYPVFKPANGH